MNHLEWMIYEMENEGMIQSITIFIPSNPQQPIHSLRVEHQ